MALRYRHIFNQVATVEWAMAGAVGFIILALLAFATIHYRAGRGHSPSKKAHATRLELGYWGFLYCVALGLYVWTISRNGAERTFYTNEPAVTVDVNGHQWCWTFTYPHAHVVSTNSCIGAIPRKPRAAHSSLPVLELPTDTTIRLNVESSDVIHGFWLPYIDFKMYAYPDHVNSFEVRFDHPSVHIGRCAVFCGLYHARMDYLVRIVEPATFHRWLDAHKGLSSTSAKEAAA